MSFGPFTEPIQGERQAWTSQSYEKCVFQPNQPHANDHHDGRPGWRITVVVSQYYCPKQYSRQMATNSTRLAADTIIHSFERVKGPQGKGTRDTQARKQQRKVRYLVA